MWQFLLAVSFFFFSMYQFFIDALTNHHKCDHLTVLKVRLPCLFQLLGGGACTSWLVVLFGLQASKGGWDCLRLHHRPRSPSLFPFLTLILLLLLSVGRTLVVTVGPPSWSNVISRFKNLNLITYAKSFLPCKGEVTDSRFQDCDMNDFGRPHFS